MNVSLESSSVFLYSKLLGHAARDNSSWVSLKSQNANIDLIIKAMSVQDNDMKIMYKEEINTTTMFYLTAQIGNGSDYVAIHRTYPGMAKNNDTYDPTLRCWFTHAPLNAVHLHGPYMDTFLRQGVITLSSAQHTQLRASSTSQPIKVVAAAVLLISQLQSVGNLNLFL